MNGRIILQSKRETSPIFSRLKTFPLSSKSLLITKWRGEEGSLSDAMRDMDCKSIVGKDQVWKLQLMSTSTGQIEDV